MIFWLALAVAAAFLGALMYARSERERIRLLERRHKRQYRDVKYDFNRFNTSKSRRTTVRLRDDRLQIRTDLSRIVVENERLAAEIGSQLNLYHLGLDLAVVPFAGTYVSTDEPFEDRTPRTLTIQGRGIDTGVLVAEVTEVTGIQLPIDVAGMGVGCRVIAMRRRDGERLVEGLGLTPGDHEFEFRIDPVRFRLEVDLEPVAVESLHEAVG